MNLTFTQYTLSNGLTVIIKENHVARSVVLRGYVPGGANLERADQAGLASFTTSAMRRGTAKHTYTEINELVEAVAASVFVNAGRHQISFGGKCLAEDFGMVAAIMADTLLCPTFPPDEVEKLRGQTLTDLKEDEDDTHAMAGRYFREMLYTPDHPYGRSVDGTLSSIANLTRADLLDYHQRLHPQNGAVVVVGDVSGEQVYQTLESLLGQWQPPHTPPPDTDVPAPRPLTTPARHLHPMPGKFQADVVVGWLGPNRRAADFYAAYVGNTILGQLGLGGRIGLSVRDQEGLAYYANSNLQGGSGPGPWLAFAGVNPAGLERAIDLMLAEVRRFRAEPVTAAELADAKAYLTGVLPLQMEANEGVAGILMDMHYFQLGDDFIARYPDIINGVTVEQVQAAAQKYLNDEVYALAAAGPLEG